MADHEPNGKSHTMEGLEGRLSETLQNIEAFENKKRDSITNQNDLFSNIDQDDLFKTQISQTTEFNYQFTSNDIKDLTQPQPQPSSEMDSLLLLNENVYQTLQPVQVFDFPTSSEPKVYQQLQSLSQKNVSMTFDQEFSMHQELTSIDRKEVNPSFQDKKAYTQLEPVSTSTTTVQKRTEIRHQTKPIPFFHQENKTVTQLIPVGSTCNQLRPVGSSTPSPRGAGISPKARPTSSSYEPPVTSSKLYQHLCRPLIKPAKIDTHPASQIQSVHSDNSTSDSKTKLSKILLDSTSESVLSHQSQGLHTQKPGKVASTGHSVNLDINSHFKMPAIVGIKNGNSSRTENKVLKGFPEHKPKVYLELREPNARKEPRMNFHSTSSTFGHPSNSEKSFLVTGDVSGVALNQPPLTSTLNELKAESRTFISLNSPFAKVSEARLASSTSNMETFLDTSTRAKTSPGNNTFMFIKPSIPSLKQSLSSLSLPKRPVCFGDSSFNNACKHSQVDNKKDLMTNMIVNKSQTVRKSPDVPYASIQGLRPSAEPNNCSDSSSPVPKIISQNQAITANSREELGMIRISTNVSTMPNYTENNQKQNVLLPFEQTVSHSLSSNQNPPKTNCSYPTSKNLESSDFLNCFENFPNANWSIEESLAKDVSTVNTFGLKQDEKNSATVKQITLTVLKSEILLDETNLKTSNSDQCQKSDVGLKQNSDLNEGISDIMEGLKVDSSHINFLNQLRKDDEPKSQVKEEFKKIDTKTSCVNILKRKILTSTNIDAQESVDKKLQISNQVEMIKNTDDQCVSKLLDKEFVKVEPLSKKTKIIRSNLAIKNKLWRNKQAKEALKLKYKRNHEANMPRLGIKPNVKETRLILEGEASGRNRLPLRSKLNRNWKLPKSRSYVLLSKGNPPDSNEKGISTNVLKSKGGKKMLPIHHEPLSKLAKPSVAECDIKQTTSLKTPVILLTDIAEEVKNASPKQSVEDLTSKIDSQLINTKCEKTMTNSEGVISKSLKSSQKWKPHKARRYLTNYSNHLTDLESTLHNESKLTNKRKPGRPRKSMESTTCNEGKITNKRKPGRPRKIVESTMHNEKRLTSKRKPGRPRKNKEYMMYNENKLANKRKRGRPKKHFPCSKDSFIINQMNVKTVGKPHRARKYAFIPALEDDEVSGCTRKKYDINKPVKEHKITQHRTNEESVVPSRKSSRKIKRKNFYLPHEEILRTKAHGNQKIKTKRHYKKLRRPPKSTFLESLVEEKENLIDPLMGGLISDDDDELFLGFVDDSTDEYDESKSNCNIKISAVSTSNSVGMERQGSDSMTVECDPDTLLLQAESNTLQCPQCDLIVDSQVELTDHVQSHLDSPSTSAAKVGKRFSCPVCHKLYTTSAYVKKHLETIHHKPVITTLTSSDCNVTPSSKELHEAKANDLLFQCDKCLKGFEKLTNLNRHKQLHEDDEVSFPCAYCDEKFPTKDLLRSHWSSHMNRNTFVCEVCNEKFSAAEDLKTHKLLHEKVKPFRCEICQQSFSMLGTLRTHILEHSEPKRFECKKCNKTYSRKDTLTLHQRVHTGEKNYECDICHQKFRWRHGVKSHKLIYHSTAKPYQCELCKKKFSHPNSFKKHAEVHREKMFYCEICLKPFARLTTLKTHLLIHTDLKKFTCNICDKSFRIKGHLRSHLLVHTKEKPCKCKYCSKSFKNNVQLRRHNQLMHCEEIYDKLMPELPKTSNTAVEDPIDYSEGEVEFQPTVSSEEAGIECLEEEANQSSDHFILSCIEGNCSQTKESVLSPSVF